MERTLDIGLDDSSRADVAHGLGKLLADTLVLQLKAQNFHWNVTGPLFPMLHDLFGRQYTELSEAADALAERIRALGHPTPATWRQLADLSAIPEETGVPRADDMVKRLLEAHETAARTARRIQKTAERVGDAPSADMLTGRLAAHEKAAWMLRSALG
jgi:starvation-inducible DNA-binding protein